MQDDVRDDGRPGARAAATTMELTVVHPVEFDPATMTLAEIEAMTDLGQFATERRSVSTRTLAPDEEVDALAALGVAPGFLDPTPPARR